MIYGGHFDINSQKEKIKSLEQETSKENFWNDREQAEKIIKELQLKKMIYYFRQWEVQEVLQFIMKIIN